VFLLLPFGYGETIRRVLEMSLASEESQNAATLVHQTNYVKYLSFYAQFFTVSGLPVDARTRKLTAKRRSLSFIEAVWDSTNYDRRGITAVPVDDQGETHGTRAL
jgi:hypothetical protein